MDAKARIAKIKTKSLSFRYQYLDRMRSQCDYYLGYGNKYIGHLNNNDPKLHIQEMKDYWNAFTAEEKPQWLTMEQIKKYEVLMITGVENYDDIMLKSLIDAFRYYITDGDFSAIKLYKWSPLEHLKYIEKLCDKQQNPEIKAVAKEKLKHFKEVFGKFQRGEIKSTRR